MRVEKKVFKKANKQFLGFVLIIYSIIHHLVFGFDIWVIFFLILACYWIFFKRSKDNKGRGSSSIKKGARENGDR